MGKPVRLVEMAIFVDACLWTWRERRMCHCVSDVSYDELHGFMIELGVPRRAFHADHYDLDETYRSLAIERGAVEVTSRELVRRLRVAGLRAPRPQRIGE